VASLGDLDGDGVADLAVGADGDDTGGDRRGAVHVLLLNANGTVQSSTKIASGTNGGPALVNTDFFGISVASLGDLDGDGVADLAVGARGDKTGGTDRGAVHVLFLNAARPDFGDAPDTGAATGVRNYQTLLADNGSRHTIVAGLRMGANIDAESDAAANARANGDDAAGTLPDDEDGLVEPLQDLVLTVGAQPQVRVRVTNTTGAAATLYGWIDYYQDGVFDNATERTSVSVSSGSTNVIATLTFPSVPSGSAGKTYARFRLSTDAAAGNPTGAANDGEVEDYVATITNRSGTPADSAKTKKIASGTNGGPTLPDRDYFGSSVASLGDLDGDGVTDLAVGAFRDGTGGIDRGAVYVLMMNSNGTVKSSTKIASDTNGGPTLSDGDYFSNSVASLGDLDGDGVSDLTVGAYRDDTGGTSRGAVHVLFMNSNGTVKSSMKIANGTGGGPTLADGDNFGHSVASPGDLDGDGVTDLAVGASTDGTGGPVRGAVYVLLMNSNGTVKSSTKIASGTNGGPTLANSVRFGSSVASLGDLDGDGVTDLAVGAHLDDTGGFNRGAVHVLSMNSNGTVKSSTKIAHQLNGGPTLANQDYFGSSVASLGDLDGDGVTDLAVGANRDDTGGNGRGAVYVLLMNTNATVKSTTKMVSGTNGGPTLDDGDYFGFSVASLGDLDGDGQTDLAVGTTRDSTGGVDRGAVYTLFLTPPANTAPVLDNTGTPYVVAPAGTRLPTEMSNGILITDLLARGAGSNPITDADAGAVEGIGITGQNTTSGGVSLGTWQYTFVVSPQSSDWINVDTAGAVSNTSALLLPDTARLRFVTTLMPRHNNQATDGSPRTPAEGFLPLETKLDTGITFRAWDRTTGTAGGRGDTSTNGGTTAFSTATETAGTYFETRLFRSFNAAAQLNTYTLEQEFTALTSLFGYQDRSTSDFSGFTILMSPISGVTTSALYRMYFGIAFDSPSPGVQTDMGYRYLTTDLNEATFLENLGPASQRPNRDGTYFRELGVNGGTGITGYIYGTQQPGTSSMVQIYRTDLFSKDTRTGPPGSTATGTVQQEQGDHAYTTKPTFEMTKTPGQQHVEGVQRGWRLESPRGFARELSPNVGGEQQPARSASVQAGESVIESSRAIVPLIGREPIADDFDSPLTVAGLMDSLGAVQSNAGEPSRHSEPSLASLSLLRRRAGFRSLPGGPAAGQLSGQALRGNSTAHRIPFGSDHTDSIDSLFCRWDDLVGLLP
jgi:hypothetical protein